MAGVGRGRPPGSSRPAIEVIAIELFLRDGFAGTTIDAISRAAGVSKTSFFRYFDSKAEIVWAEFDAHTERLRHRLRDHDSADLPSLEVVRRVIIDTLRTDLDDEGLSMRRFLLLDTSAELRSEESEHWLSWAESISAYLARRHGLDAEAPVAQAVGGAIQAAFLATLRRWTRRPVDSEALLSDLDVTLAPICEAMQPLLGP